MFGRFTTHPGTPDRSGGSRRPLPKGSEMAKAKAAREHVWLRCTDCGDLNYRISVNLKGGLPEKLKSGLKKYCPRTRNHVLHKIKRK